MNALQGEKKKKEPGCRVNHRGHTHTPVDYMYLFSSSTHPAVFLASRCTFGVSFGRLFLFAYNAY